MQYVRDVTHWGPPIRCQEPASNALFFTVKQTKNLLYDRISLRKVSRGTKFKEKDRSGGSRFQTCDVTRVLQSDWPAKICARGSKTV